MADEFADLMPKDEFSDLMPSDDSDAYVPPSIYGGFGPLKESVKGIGEVGLTMGTGAIASIASGAAAAGTLAVNETMPGFNIGFDTIKEEMDAFNDAFTYQPRTESGQWVLQEIAGPMLYIDDTADAIATKLGGGNPWAETIIKTTVLGTLELAAPSKGIKSANAAIRHMRESRAAISETANTLGISPNIRELKESVVESAKRMTPDEKGANAPMLQEAMREAEVLARAEKNAAYEVAKGKDVWVDTRSINDLGAETRMKLSETYDISEMTKLNKRLQEMMIEFPPGARVKFWELEKIRRRINNNWRGLRRSDPEQASALASLKKDMDRFIENEFNKTALEVGQQGPIPLNAVIKKGIIDANATAAINPPVPSGHTRLYRAESPTVKFEDAFKVEELGGFADARNLPGKRYTNDINYADYFRETYGRDATINYIDVPTPSLEKVRIGVNEFKIDTTRKITGEHSGIAAWNRARELNARWKEDFHADRAISDLIKQDATPEVMTDWILGATAMGGKKQAVATVARIKQVLGDNHPAIEGIRQDFLFRVAEPLLQETPNFNQFINNYDRMIRRNHTLVNELGLSESNFTELVTFAREAKKLPINERDFKLQDLTRGLAVFWQGHEMAKRSLRVGYARNILNGLFNMDRVAQKTLLYDMAGIRYGYPMFPQKGPLAAKFIAGASLQELLREQEGREISVAETALEANK